MLNSSVALPENEQKIRLDFVLIRAGRTGWRAARTDAGHNKMSNINILAWEAIISSRILRPITVSHLVMLGRADWITGNVCCIVSLHNIAALENKFAWFATRGQCKTR